MLEQYWRTYVGIAADSIKATNQKELEVYCPELLPLYDGFPDPVDDKRVIALKDANGKPVSGTVVLRPTIKAKYLGGDTNHHIPDIHKGEQLLIHNYAGSEEFYWTPMGRDDDIRKFEHRRIYVADIAKTIKKLDGSNTYYFELDTRGDKHVVISTAKSDGEEFAYLIKIDAKANTVTIEDDSGNKIFLDSNIPRILHTLRTTTTVDLNNEDIRVFAPKNITIEAGGTLTCKSKNRVDETEKTHSVKAKDLKLEIENVVKQQSKQWEALTIAKAQLNAKEMSINADKGNCGKGNPFQSKPCG